MTVPKVKDYAEAGAIVLPKAIGFSVLGTGIATAIWLGTLYADSAARVTALETRDKDLRERLDERAGANAKRIDNLEGVKDRVIRLEEKIVGFTAVLERLDAKLDRVR